MPRRVIGTEGGLSYFEDVAEDASDEFTPTQALLASVLEVALLDFARPGHSVKVSRYRSNARRWLFGTPLAGDGLDFEHICDALNIQPEVIRKLAIAGRVRVSPLADSKPSRRRPFVSLRAELSDEVSDMSRSA